MANRYTDEQRLYLKENVSMPRKQMVDDFNAKFNDNRKRRTIDAYLNANGWSKDNSSGAKKGVVAWNKGLKGVNGTSSTIFKKGHKPWNKGFCYFYGNTDEQFKKGHPPYNANKPLGHEYKSRNDAIMIKTKFGPNGYEVKNRYVYRKYNGELSDDEVVLFKDGDNRNFEPDNLEKFNRVENLILNLDGYGKAPLELKETIKFVAKIKAKVYERK